MSTNPENPTASTTVYVDLLVDLLARLTTILRRAALPELMFTDDIALAMKMKVAAARQAVLQGRYGPYSRDGRRLVVRREAFLEAREALEAQEADQLTGSSSEAQQRPRRPEPWTERLMHRRAEDGGDA
jgi:hypothetical protein